MNNENTKSGSLQSLTILWALNESALGGVMHALKMPFTGFFVGGFAVVCIGLISFYSHFNFKQILKATLLVILVKSAVSPHSPIAAYFAVAFQGFFGALLYCTIKNYTAASVLFGCIALVESALQKFIILTILFGKSLWQAIDIFMRDVLKIFNLDADISFSNWLILSYTIVYALWGLLLGWWISKLPRQIQAGTPERIEQLKAFENQTVLSPGQKEKNMHKLFWIVVILAFVSAILLSKNSSHQALFVIARTVAALFIVFFVITPLIKWLLTKTSAKNKQAMEALIEQLPRVQKLVYQSWQLANRNFTGLRKYKEFIFTLIVATLNYNNHD